MCNLGTATRTLASYLGSPMYTAVGSCRTLLSWYFLACPTLPLPGMTARHEYEPSSLCHTPPMRSSFVILAWALWL